jgi:hypothetical protein
MNLELEILKEHSKRNTEKIARWIGDHPQRFEQLLLLFLNGEHLITQRSAWILGICVEKNPLLIKPWLTKVIKKMQEPGVHNAVKRNVVRILQFIPIPRSQQGVVANLCFDFLKSLDAPIAVKAFSMTVLANIARCEPDLKNELFPVIDQLVQFGGPGIQSRGKKVLQQLTH